MKKRVTIGQLQERRAKVDELVRGIRDVLDAYKSEAAKIDKKRFSEAGYRDEVNKVRAKFEGRLNGIDKAIVAEIGDAFDHQWAWTREAMLRDARFFPAYEGHPGTVEAQQKAINSELLETFRRGFAEARARDYANQDLAAEMESAATNGDVALCAVLAQQARNRVLKGTLQGEERLAVDQAFRKLEMPDVGEAEQAYKDFDALLREAQGLAALWRNPQDRSGLDQEQLGRIARTQRARRFLQAIEAGVSEAEAAKLQWRYDPAKPDLKAAEVKKPAPVIPLEKEQPSPTQPDAAAKVKAEADAAEQRLIPEPTGLPTPAPEPPPMAA